MSAAPAEWPQDRVCLPMKIPRGATWQLDYVALGNVEIDRAEASQRVRQPAELRDIRVRHSWIVEIMRRVQLFVDFVPLP